MISEIPMKLKRVGARDVGEAEVNKNKGCWRSLSEQEQGMLAKLKRTRTRAIGIDENT